MFGLLVKKQKMTIDLLQPHSTNLLKVVSKKTLYTKLTASVINLS